MKSIIQFINESRFSENVKKCKTFGEFFFLYTGYNSIDEMNEEDYDSYDYGYTFNREDDSLEEFKKWFETVKDNKITNIKIRSINGGEDAVSFKMGKELFDMDFLDE